MGQYPGPGPGIRATDRSLANYVQPVSGLDSDLGTRAPATPEHQWSDPDSVCGQTQTVENVRLAPSLVSPRLLFVASWQSGHFVTKLGPVRNWIITSSSSRICRDLRILLTLIPGNSSQLAMMLCIRELSLGGKHAAREISSYLDLCYWVKWSRNHALTLLHRTSDDRHLYLSPANTHYTSEDCKNTKYWRWRHRSALDASSDSEYDKHALISDLWHIIIVIGVYSDNTLGVSVHWERAAPPGSDGSAPARPAAVSATMGRAQFCLRRDLGRTHVTPLRRPSQLRDIVTRAWQITSPTSDFSLV